ncbi:MAG: hypothetical protein E6R13_02330 [Spirochaetes bacterium]|nr:MAG: hypothetical protein E6R13_02330 [Spirochaetota bacterium]
MSNYAEQLALSSAKAQATMRDSQIDVNGFEVELLSNPHANDLTEFGQVSYYTQRDLTTIKIVTDLENWYAMLPFDGNGKVLETYEKKEFPCSVKTTDIINQGDIIRVVYSYFEGTVEPKYYQVKKVLVSSIIIPISKKIILTPYTLPVKIEQTTNPISDYKDSQPVFDMSNDFI